MSAQPWRNAAAGEDIRWLARHLATGLLLPANDYWVFDGQRAQFKYFSGAGKFLDTRLSGDPEIAKRCAAAFEAVWERAIPTRTTSSASRPHRRCSRLPQAPTRPARSWPTASVTCGATPG